MEANQKTHVIELSEDFQVPVETLFQAWTDAEQLKQWWHPMGDSLKNVKNELEKDGAVEYDFDSEKFRVSGTYSHVEPNKILVYSWNWAFSDEMQNEDYTLTISFEAADNGSRITVLQEGLSGEDVIPAHEEGWKTGLESLKAFVEGSEGKPEHNVSAADNLKSDEGQSDRSGGYNEAPEQVKVGGG